MLDAADVVQILVWGGLGVVYAIQTRSVAKAKARAEAGIAHLACVRCGTGIEPEASGRPRSLCATCLKTLKRGYRAASAFLFGLGGFTALMAPKTIITEWQLFGDRTGFAEVGLFVGMTAIFAASGWFLHRAAATLQ